MNGGFAYYPGCRLRQDAKSYAASLEETFRRIDVGFEEVADWNCCGATSARSSAPGAAQALAARNLRLAAGLGKPLVAACSVCYRNLREAMVEAERAGRDAENPLNVLHPLEVLAAEDRIASLGEKVKIPLEGLRVASYYGCLLSTRPESNAFDDAENPVSMDRIMEALGAEAVDWSGKTDCCGHHLAMAAPRVAIDLVARILTAAEEAGANAIAAACPHCHANLDILQFEVSKALRRKVEMPVFYFTELIGVALDCPGAEKWLSRHITTPFPLIDSLLEAW